MIIPHYVLGWFAKKKWHIHAYQKAMFNAFMDQQSTLLIAPTGSGKTLASFLPSLVDIHENFSSGLHTLYISPLKSLTYDIKRNLLKPIEEMQLNIRVETRTGDTSSYQRLRQLKQAPNILLTTPESLTLLLSYPQAREYFKNLKLIIIDELHNFIYNKRGDLTVLALARLWSIADKMTAFGLSATVAQPENFAKWLVPTGRPTTILKIANQQQPFIRFLTNGNKIPYCGINAKYALEEIYQTIHHHSLTLIFVNTRAQAELLFHQLWNINQANLPIAIYHGSLHKDQRVKTEALAAVGKLRAIVATSALELGIDWGNIECVMQINSPKGVSRLIQRIGRSNHQFDKASYAVLVPTNCFEMLECQATINAVAEGHLDDEPIAWGALDVAIQFIINCACSEPILPEKIFQLICSAFPYRNITPEIFDKLMTFSINGGYVLQHYERYQRLKINTAGAYEIASRKIMLQHRQNIGTIFSPAYLKVKLKYKRGGKWLGEIEENFIQQLMPGDAFIFAGKVVEFIRVKDMMLEVGHSDKKKAKLISYPGAKMPLSTYLAHAVKKIINNPPLWPTLPEKIQDWLNLQNKYSILPQENIFLVEHFPYKKNFYTLFYTFKGRTANNTLGILLTRKMEQAKFKPLSFTVTDYGLAINSIKTISESELYQLMSPETLTKDINDWLQNSPAIKSTFRQIAVITGLTQRQIAGKYKSMRQITFSTDLIYDVLQKYEPAHILLYITRQEIEKNLFDVESLFLIINKLLKKLVFITLAKPSPLSLNFIMAFKTQSLEGDALEELLAKSESETEANNILAEVRKIVN